MVNSLLNQLLKMVRKIVIKQSNRDKETESEVKQKRTATSSEAFLETLQKRFPNKFQFSMSEASEVTSLSYDFLRERIKKGSISAVKFGDKYMISQFELARILSQGVK